MAKKGTTTTKDPKSTGTDSEKVYSQFAGGLQRDDKSAIAGGGLAIEELDILENANFVRPAQVFSADATVPANQAFHSYCEDPLLGTGYAVGGDNNGNTYAQVFYNTAIGTPTASGWTSVGSNAPLVANPISGSAVHYEIESGATTPTLAVYFITGQNVVTRYTASGNIATTVWTLSTLTSNMGHISFREINTITYIAAGNYISTIDPGSTSTGPNFNEKAFALPTGYVAIDICQAGQYYFILAETSDLISNKSVIFIWDGVSPQYTDQIPVPMGGPQWIYNFKQTVTICCTAGGKMKLFYLNAPTVGALCKAYPNIQIQNVQLPNQTLWIGATGNHGVNWVVPVSPSKSVFVKDDILYFALWKFDKTALYALGQLDSKSPFALWLAKRFSTADYSQMVPFAAYCFGQKIFAAFQTGYFTQGTNATNCAICDPAIANRSSQAIFTSTWDDDGEPMNPKDLIRAYMQSYPIPRGCSLQLNFAFDYGTTYTTMVQAGNSIMNTLNQVFSIMRPTGALNKKLFQWQVAFTSRQSVVTTLNGTITSSATTVVITSGTGFVNGDIISIDQEQMTIVSGGGTTTLTVTRGTNGTIRYPHTSGVNVVDLSVAPQLTAVGMRKIIKALDA
jgi:hypothetical protein